MNLNPRSTWTPTPAGGNPMALPAPRLWLHHGASSNTYTREQVPAILRAYRTHHLSNGWADIGYSFAVDRFGGLWECRGAGKTGAHTEGDNSKSHGICAIGNYSTLNPPEELLSAVAWLLIHGKTQGWWPAPKLTGGHRDAPGAQTSCPGDKLHAAIPIINALASGPEEVEDMNEAVLLSSTDSAKVYVVPFVGRIIPVNDGKYLPGLHARFGEVLEVSPAEMQHILSRP